MIGFPFDSHVTFNADGVPSYDRAISSEPYRKLLKQLFKTGILPTVSTNMQVSAGEGMNVIVAEGFAIVEGCMKLEENQRTLAVQASHNTYDRIDTVVLRLDTNDDVRACDFYVVEGTPSQSPVRPALIRNNSIYELGLADVFVPAQSVTIQDFRITDTRYEDERCGVLSSISEFDTETIYKQVQDDLIYFKEVNEVEFRDWFETIKGILGEDEAGRILLLMGDLVRLTTDDKTSLVNAINEIDMTTMKASVDEETEVEEFNIPVNDADALGGHPVEYFATNENLAQLENKIFEPTKFTTRTSQSISATSSADNIKSVTITENGYYNIYVNGTVLALSVNNSVNGSYEFHKTSNATEMMSTVRYYNKNDVIYYSAVGSSPLLLHYT